MNNHPPVGVREHHLWRWAIVWGLVLGLIFFATYNNVNQYTLSLEPVDSFYFAWEIDIPFWPWTIVPYWSIDLFYGLALFLASTKSLLIRLVKRLLLAQLLCITGFLLFPLKFAFVRPETEGFFGSLFTALAQFDLPYNQAPSLHIVLLVVLWRQYLIYAGASPWRYLVNGWSWLIALSVLTTWQHHFIDVVTGVVVGVFCLVAIPEGAGSWQLSPTPAAPRRRMASYYCLGAAVWALLAWWTPVSVFSGVCWWIAAALLYVAGVYWWGNGVHLGKQAKGCIPLSHYCFLAPYYIGARINVWWHLRHRAHYSEIVHGVYLGALSAVPGLMTHLTQTRASPLIGLVDFTAELPRPTIDAGVTYQSLPQLDLLLMDAQQLRRAARAVAFAQQQGAVMVACALGVSRSAAAIAAWLIIYRGYSLDAALNLVRQQRPCVVFRGDQLNELQKLHELLTHPHMTCTDQPRANISTVDL
jgi:hypothetical protein